MLTDIGKELRKLRLERNERLVDMAKKLDCSAAFISAIELGRKKAPQTFIDDVVKEYGLDEEAAERLQSIRDQSLETFTLVAASPFARDTASLLARRFPTLSPEKLQTIRKVIGDRKETPRGKRVSRAG